MLSASLARQFTGFYIKYAFWRARRNSATIGAVFFDRAAFASEVQTLKTPTDLVLSSRLLRVLLRFAVDRYRLEQIICLACGSSLKSEFKTIIELFGKECGRSGVKRVYFGGIDYFEVAIFEEAARRAGCETIAVFHENYTVPVVIAQTRSLFASYPPVPMFTEVYSIGPVAKELLGILYAEVGKLPVKRFQFSEKCSEFSYQILLFPFGRIEYCVQTAFTLTYMFLDSLITGNDIRVVVKHKNSTEQRQFLKTYGRTKGVDHVLTPDARTLCGLSRLVICYNSLVYYEALAYGHLIALPATGEARDEQVYSQHQNSKQLYDAGIRTFSSEGELDLIFKEAMTLKPQNRLKWAAARRQLLDAVFFTEPN